MIPIRDTTPTKTVPVVNNTIVGNTAAIRGGGLSAMNGSTFCVVNTIIRDNHIMNALVRESSKRSRMMSAAARR